MSDGYRHNQHIAQRLVVTLSEPIEGAPPQAGDFERAAKFLAARACFFRAGPALSESLYRIADRLSAGDVLLFDYQGRFAWRSGMPDASVVEILNAPSARPADPPVKPRGVASDLRFWAGALSACIGFCLVQLAFAAWGAF